MSDDKEEEQEKPRRALTPAQMVWAAWAGMTLSLAVLLMGAGALGRDPVRCVLVAGGVWGVIATVTSLCLSVSSYSVKKCADCSASIYVSESNWTCGKCGKKDRENAAATTKSYLTAAKFLFVLAKRIEQLGMDDPNGYRDAVREIAKKRHDVKPEAVRAAETESS